MSNASNAYSILQRYDSMIRFLFVIFGKYNTISVNVLYNIKPLRSFPYDDCIFS